MIRFLFLLIFTISIYSQSNYTDLRDPNHIQIYQYVTDNIRCICLPSLPIKSCSYSNCQPSAILKDFIEYRIKSNESADKIINGIIYGYGESFSKDPYIQKLISDGNEGIAQRLIYGFGEKMIAKPDPIWINLTLIIAITGGLSAIGIYIKIRNKKKISDQSISNTAISTDDAALKNYLKEI
jgi:cytochrome c-type biogenesis protein CcmH/NrfF